jgi:hypothetical protein
LTDRFDWNERRTRREPIPAAATPIVRPVTLNGTTDAYGQAALTAELDQLLATTEGGRNDQLNRSAFSLAQLVAAGRLPNEQTQDQLRGAARQIGLSPGEVEATLRSAFRAGTSLPRDVPELAVASVTEVTALQLAPATADQVEKEEPGEKARTSWWPRPLRQRAADAVEEPAPTHLIRDDGQPLLYSGKVNGLIGESESGKSWVALLAVTQAAAAGQHVLILDFEDSPASIDRRLTALGLTDHTDLIDYANPDESLTLLASQDLTEALTEHSYALIVADGVNAAMTLLGYDLNSNTDATLFTTKLLRPLARTGACVITVDHVPKNVDQRGKGGIGAQAKRAMLDGTSLLVEVVEPFGKGQSGELRLTVDKDRNGHVRGASAGGRYAGKAHLDSVGDQVRIHITGPDLRTPEERAQWQPTGVMEKVSRLLEKLNASVSYRAIEEAVGGRKDVVKKAVNALVDGGYIKLTPGPNRSIQHTLERPFREADEPISPVSPGVPQVSPGDTQAGVPQPVPPYGDGGHPATTPGTPVSPTKTGDTQPDYPAGHSDCNQCGTPTPDKIINETGGYCAKCGWANR